MSKVESAVQWAIKIANDNTHKYSQNDRWGPHYDCSSFLISAYQQAGVPVRTNGANDTTNMYSKFIQTGFTNVKSQVNTSTGSGLIRGDVLIESGHTVMYIGGEQIVHASNTKDGILVQSYSAYYKARSWLYVLRFPENTERYQLHSFAANRKIYDTKTKQYVINDWAVINGKSYRTGPDGLCLKEWQDNVDKRKRVYFFGPDWHLHAGWLSFKSTKYYMGSNGDMYTGLKTIASKIYYFGTDGVMRTGWQTVSNKRYYFTADGPAFIGWATFGTQKFYFDSNGVMATGFKTISSASYYFNSEGVMQTGWQTVNGKKYYMDATGKMVSGWNNFGSQRFYFDSTGAMATGWKTIGSNKYYFHLQDGYMLKGWQDISGKRYFFANDDGRMWIGWASFGSAKYYFDSNGVMVTGTRVIDGKQYTFDSNGVLKS